LAQSRRWRKLLLRNGRVNPAWICAQPISAAANLRAGHRQAGPRGFEVRSSHRLISRLRFSQILHPQHPGLACLFHSWLGLCIKRGSQPIKGPYARSKALGSAILQGLYSKDTYPYLFPQERNSCLKYPQPRNQGNLNGSAALPMKTKQRILHCSRYTEKNRKRRLRPRTAYGKSPLIPGGHAARGQHLRPKTLVLPTLG
jgi:hypothetical protein